MHDIRSHPYARTRAEGLNPQFRRIPRYPTGSKRCLRCVAPRPGELGHLYLGEPMMARVLRSTSIKTESPNVVSAACRSGDKLFVSNLQASSVVMAMVATWLPMTSAKSQPCPEATRCHVATTGPDMSIVTVSPGSRVWLARLCG